MRCLRSSKNSGYPARMGVVGFMRGNVFADRRKSSTAPPMLRLLVASAPAGGLAGSNPAPAPNLGPRIYPRAFLLLLYVRQIPQSAMQKPEPALAGGVVR